MARPLFQEFDYPPAELIEIWPEVFHDLQMNTIPIEYLNGVTLHFHDGREWCIDLQSQLVNATPDFVNEKLLETLNDYRDDILKIDFKINVDQLIHDIVSQTELLLT